MCDERYQAISVTTIGDFISFVICRISTGGGPGRTLYELAAEWARSNGGTSAGALRFQGFHDLA